MNSAVKWALGLAGLGIAVYVAGRAWRMAQNGQNSDEANFSYAGGGPRGAGIIPKTSVRCLCNGIRRDCPCPKAN